MYVCLCHAVTEEEIRSHVAAGASMQELQIQLRAGTCCGCCLDEMATYLSQGENASRSASLEQVA